MAGRLPGGNRSGGRKPGSLNKRTIRELEGIREAAASLGAPLDDDAIAQMQPLDILMHVARISLKAGNLTLAVSASERAAKYVHVALTANSVEFAPRSLMDLSDAQLDELIKLEAPAVSEVEDFSFAPSSRNHRL